MNKPGTTLSLDSLAQSARRLFMPVFQHLTLIVWLVTIGLIIYALIVTSAIIDQSDDQAYRDSQQETRIQSDFDRATIEQINNLSVSSDSSAAELPAGRRNPFVR